MDHETRQPAMIKPSVPQPKHEQLRDYLLGELNAGRLKPGDLLPREVELAETMNVARNTARQALAELERQGLILRIRGKGTFVHDDAPTRLKTPTGIFALVVPESRRGFYPSLLHGFGAATRALHGQVIVSDTDNDVMHQADILLQLLDQKVSGVAIVPTYDTPAHHIRPLQQRGVPVVLCHRSVAGVAAPLVGFDAKAVGKLAAQALHEHGHRHVAFFASSPGGLTSDYIQGFRQALVHVNKELPDSHVFIGDAIQRTVTQDQAVQQALKTMLASAEPPTAIMTSFDSEAELIYLMLTQMGIRIPEQVSLVSFGGAYREGPVLQKLAAVEVDEEHLGKRAAEVLEEIRTQKRPLQEAAYIQIPLRFRKRETLGYCKECKKG